MSYTTRDALETIIPPQFILQALDDDGDGVEDSGLWEKLSNAADTAVDAYLSGRYATPFSTTIPALVSEAAKTFLAESIYMRRGYESDRNPHTARANKLRTQLENIGNGNGSLGGVSSDASGSGAGRAPVSIVAEAARTIPTSRLNG